MIAALAGMWGETITPSGGAAANRLGLTTQNPVRLVFPTSDPDQRLHFDFGTQLPCQAENATSNRLK